MTQNQRAALARVYYHRGRLDEAMARMDDAVEVVRLRQQDLEDAIRDAEHTIPMPDMVAVAVDVSDEGPMD